MHVGTQKLLQAFGTVLAALCVGSALCAAPPSDFHGPHFSQTGYIQLSWNLESAVKIEIKSLFAKDPPRLLCSVQGSSCFQSGLEDGIYRLDLYRETTDQAGRATWVLSEQSLLLVQHHSMAVALGFFYGGAFVFLSTVALILTGHIHSGNGTVGSNPRS